MKQVKKKPKYFLIFCLTLCASFAAGAGIAVGLGYLQDHFGGDVAWLEILKRRLVIGLPIGYGVLLIAAFAVCSAIYVRAKKRAARWDGEEETEIEQVETVLSAPLLIQSVMLILNMLFFPVMIQLTEFSEIPESWENWTFPVTLALFALGYVFYVLVTMWVVNLEKKLNPEKRGNVFDARFMKKWENSCDEAEQLMICKASRVGYKAGTTACMVLWVIALLCQMFFSTGLLPVVCVCVIWLTMVLSYFVACIRLGKTKRIAISG